MALREIILETTTKNQIIKDGGFVGNNGVWNSIKMIPGDRNIYRDCIETLIIKNQSVYLWMKKDEYRVPGGSKEHNVPDNIQALAECKEEARIIVKNLQYSGLHYIVEDDSSKKSWAKDFPIHWTHKYIDIYVGEYDGKYTGIISEEDQDNGMLQNGKFYPIDVIIQSLLPEHQKAITNYLKSR